MVGWLEQLDNGAESRRKVVSSRLGLAMWRLENSLCRPSSEWVPFSILGRLRQGKDRDGLCLSSAVPKIQRYSNPNAPTAIRQWETFTFTFINTHIHKQNKKKSIWPITNVLKTCCQKLELIPSLELFGRGEGVYFIERGHFVRSNKVCNLPELLPLFPHYSSLYMTRQADMYKTVSPAFARNIA